ncbi:hypothetical protein EIP86_006816 [Pleurotus ostreatoroseus]|nr:hypothetical protein EIP86_006816 [Pleurotus ostreatoroseus]
MSKATLRRTLDDAVDGMACTDAEVASVRRLCRSSPERVVEMLRGSGTLSDAQGAKDVDKMKGSGVGPALVGVGELVKSERMSAYQIATWRKLVDAGVVDSLVFNILHSANVITASPSMPDDIREKARKQMQAPYYLAVEILSNSSRLIHLSPSPQDAMFLSALKAHWSDMMERIWNEPFNSLESEESHAFERAVVATLVHRIIMADPTFLDIAYKDRTIPVLTRIWAYSGTCAVQQIDAYMTGVVLSELVRPRTPNIVAYMRPRTKKLGKAQLISQMCVGVATTPCGTKMNQAKALVEAFASRFSLLNGQDVEAVLEMTLELLEAGKEKASGAQAWVQEVFTNDKFWRGLFSLLRRIQKGQARDSRGTSSPKHMLIQPIVLVSAAFEAATVRQRAELISTCARVGFFDALDVVVVSLLAQTNEVCRACFPTNTTVRMA